VSEPKWREVLRVHPAADEFPMLPDDELAELAADIAANGLKVPTEVYYDGHEYVVIDGRNRLTAGEMTGYEITADSAGFPAAFKDGAPAEGWFHQMMGDDLAIFEAIKSLNLARRHLTVDGRKRIALLILKRQPERSDRSVAAEVAIDHKTVAVVRAKAYGEIPHTPPSISEFPNGEIPHTPPERREASGRKARGRKPAANSAPRGAPPAKPSGPVLQRDCGVVIFADMLRRDIEQGLDDMTRIISDFIERIEQIGSEKRRALVSRYAAALGMTPPYAELSAAEETITQLQARVAELEAQLHTAVSPNQRVQMTRARSPDRARYPFAQLIVGGSFTVPDKPQSLVSSAASQFASRHGWILETRKIEGGVEVTRTA
jgi:hypothetical protein